MKNILKRYKFAEKEVVYGWGEDMIAIEFPIKLAKECLSALRKKLGKVTVAEGFLHDNCLDVVRNKEITYILSPFWADLIERAEEL
jgi:hypothetical protein